MRSGDTARKNQGLLNVSLTLIHGNPIAQRRFVLDDPRREMRHYIVTFSRQPLCGGNHIFDRCALDMRNIDAGGTGQEVTEVFNLLSGARHHFN